MKNIVLCLILIIAFAVPTFAWPDLSPKSLSFQGALQSVNSKSYLGLEMQWGLSGILGVKPSIEFGFIQLDRTFGYYDYAWPVMLNLRYDFPLLPIYVGVNGGTLIHQNDLHPADNAGPTGICGAYIGYAIRTPAMISVYTQAGVENATLHYVTAGIPFDYNFSGMTVKVGVQLGN